MQDIAGLDTSRLLLDRAVARLGCEAHLLSVLDRRLVEQVGRRFDVVVAAAVLHHLVGGTRRASRRLARRAVTNMVDLVRPGGHLVLVEPVFYPRAVMGALFHVKRAVTRFTDRRVTVGGTWNNIGAPVVSYLTNEELGRMAAGAGGRVVAAHVEDRALHPVMRAAGIRRRCETTVVVRRPRLSAGLPVAVEDR